MQLDVLRHYGCIIRLHDFDHSDLYLLKERVADLACAARPFVPLHDEPFVRPIGGCRLTLRLEEINQGIRPVMEPNLFGWRNVPGTWDPFACSLSPSGWIRVSEGINLLLRLRFLSDVHVWLHRQWSPAGPVPWLLSPDGEW